MPSSIKVSPREGISYPNGCGEARVLCWNCLNYYADNFYLFGTGIAGSGKHLQLLSDSSIRLGLHSINDLTDSLVPDSENETFVGSGDHDEERQCTVTAYTGSVHGHWYVEQVSGSNICGVRLYHIAEEGKKWYLRAHFLGRRIDLVCEDYVNSIINVSPYNYSIIIKLHTISYAYMKLDERTFFLRTRIKIRSCCINHGSHEDQFHFILDINHHHNNYYYYI